MICVDFHLFVCPRFNQFPTKMPKSLDPLWECGEPLDPHNQPKLSCKEMNRGINHLKHNLAKIPPIVIHIATQSTSPPIVIHIATQSTLKITKKKDKRGSLRLEIATRKVVRTSRITYFSRVGGTRGSESQSSATHSTMTSTSPPFILPRSSPRAQPSIRSLVKIREKREVNKIVSKCFLCNDTPFSIAKNNLIYKSMFEVVAIVGPWYKAPTYDELRGPLLQGEKSQCTNKLDEI
jgi:hypothetical protein